MMKRIVCILLSLMMLAGVLSAMAEGTAEAPAEEAVVAEAPAEEAVVAEVPTDETEDDERVLLATINGSEIWSDNTDLLYAFEYYLEMAMSYGLDTSDESVLPMLRQYAMEYALQTTLVRQKAAELGLDATEEDVAAIEAEIKANWETIVQSFIDEAGVITEDSSEDDKAAARADALATIMSAYEYDEERYMKESLEPAIYSLIEGRVQATVVGDRTVTDEEIQQYFEELVKEDQEAYENDVPTYEFYTQYYGQPSYYTPSGYRAVTHILLEVDEELMANWRDLTARFEEQQSPDETEPTEEGEGSEGEGEEKEPAEPVTQEMIDEAEKAILDSVQATVDEINAKIESGVPFDQLIVEYGKDPGMAEESYRAAGYPIHADSIMYDPAFKAAAMALGEIGEISKPIVGQSGVHIIHYLKDIPSGASELTEAMKEEFRATLQKELESDLFHSALEEWMNAAVIEYTAEGEAWKPDFDSAEEDKPAAEEAPEEEPAGPAGDEPASPADESGAADEGPASPADEAAGAAGEGPASPADEAAQTAE